MSSRMITPEEFSFSMKKIGIGEARPKIAVAVSGGGDSLALAALMQEWVSAGGGDMLALTVDHGLRPDSANEAEAVRKILQAQGIAHEIVVWQGDKPLTHVQERARDARYELLLQTCRKIGFPVLAVAHHLEDQIETFWMRLAHGSGLDGLSAMAPVREDGGISIIRPLLSFSRERLRATCTHHRINWLEDPSNQNDKYLRVKLRRFESLLADEGLSPVRLSRTLQKLEDARHALQVMTERAVAACVLLHPEGYATMKTSEWREYPRDIQRRILWQTLGMIVAAAYPAGFDAVEQTRLDLHHPSFAGKTLAGCEIFPWRGGDMLIVREAEAVEKRACLAAAQIGDAQIWDGRFNVSGFRSESLEIGALGESGVSELRKNIDAAGKLETLPFKVKLVLPALWQGENLLAVPHVNYYSPACPRSLQAGKIVFVKIGECSS